jgi:hypothetical protein
VLLDAKTTINCQVWQFLHNRLCRGCILLTHQFEFFFVFDLTNIIHLSKFIELLQSQMSFTQITQLWLTVVLFYVLICFRFFIEKFLQYHTVIYAAGGPPAGTAPGAGACPGAATGAPISSPLAGSIAAISSPVPISVSILPGLMPTLRRSCP